VDPRAGLDDVEKRKFLTLPAFGLRPLGRPARSQSLYRLSYPGHVVEVLFIERSDNVAHQQPTSMTRRCKINSIEMRVRRRNH
jgi:hypothetical protein